MRPSRRGILVAAVCFAVVLLPALGAPRAWPATPLLWGSLALLYGLDALISLRRRRVACEVRSPEVLHVGEPGCLGLLLELPGRRAAPAEVAVDLSELLEPVAPQSGFIGSDPREFRFELKARRRGTAEMERVWIRYASPVGLWSWTRVVAVDRAIQVLPNVLLVRSAALRFFNDRDFRAGLKIERYRGEGTEFDSMKEFLVGEDHRAIDWKSSARHRKLLCRQFRAERNHQVILAIDTGHLMAEPLDGVPRLDHALSAALVLAYVCLISGDRVGLFTFDSRVGPGTDPVGGLPSMRLLSRLTSRIRYSKEETNFTLGLTALAERVRRRSLVVLLTDFVDTVTAELMLENIDRIGRRHLVVFVSIRDPLLGKITHERPDTVERLSRAVVAQTLLRDRALVHRRLQRMGVHALDVEPRRIGPELINRYLDIKRRELV